MSVAELLFVWFFMIVLFDDSDILIESEDRAGQQERLRHIVEQPARHVVGLDHLVSHHHDAAHDKQHRAGILRDFEAILVFHGLDVLNGELLGLFLRPEPPLFHTAKLQKIIEKTKRFPDYFLTKTPPRHEETEAATDFRFLFSSLGNSSMTPDLLSYSQNIWCRTSCRTVTSSEVSEDIRLFNRRLSMVRI